MRKANNLPPFCAVVTKSGNLNFLEPSGSVQACNGTALPLPYITLKPVPVAARPKVWVCGRSLAGIAGSNLTRGSCECRVLSGTGLCDELITCPEESYRVWCV